MFSIGALLILSFSAFSQTCPTITQHFAYSGNSHGVYTFADGSTSVDSNATYSWTINGAATGTGKSLKDTFTVSGTYSVCETIGEPGCPNTGPLCKSVNVTITGNCPSITQHFTYTNLGGVNYTFRDSSSGQDGNATYSWTIDSTTALSGSPAQ